MNQALLDGAIDLYVHCSPDVLARQGDDVFAAEQARAAGLAAIVHRHHFQTTVDRATLAREHTGFPIFGALELVDSVGGVNVAAADVALRSGAVWISLPTLSARRFAEHNARRGMRVDPAMLIGPGGLVVVDDEGRVLPEVSDVIDLVAEHDAVLGLGYVSPAECLAVLDAAALAHVRAVVLTGPHVTGMSAGEVAEIVARPGAWLELLCMPLYWDVGRGAGTQSTEEAAALMRRVGLDHCVLSSDGGSAGAPPAAELLSWGCERLIEQGLSQAEAHALVHDGPRELLGAALAA